MKPAAFDYVRPTNVEAAVAALSAAGASGKLIAGGQSLGPMLNLRLARPTILIDIARLPELRSFEDHGRHWRIGAAVTHAEIEDAIGPVGPDRILPYVARRIAYRAVRNRGTIGGSLAHADTGADWPLVLAALDAVADLRGPRGTRRRDVADLMQSSFTTDLDDDEIIVALDVPRLSASAGWGFFKLCRKAGEFPLASAVVVVDPERDFARVLLGALPHPPRPLPLIAKALLRHGPAGVNTEALDAAIAAAAPALEPVNRRIFRGCLARAIEQAFA